jgi:hypothetical protein
LNGDGLPEILSTAPELVGLGDQVFLRTLNQDLSLDAIWSSDPMPGSCLTAAFVHAWGAFVVIEEPAEGAAGRARLWVIR